MKKKILSGIAVVALIGCLGACTQDQRTLGGAAIGAGGGALVGGALGGGTGAVIGGVAGGVTGGVIGHNTSDN